MNKTRSFLFESIQQSPIDPFMNDETTVGVGGVITPELAALLEEAPLTPPLETAKEFKLRFLNPEAWIDQLGTSRLSGQNGVSVVRNRAGGVTATRADGKAIDISLGGLDFSAGNKKYKLSDQISDVGSIPVEVLQLLSQAYETVAAWRARVVRLSMDTDEYECHLMDDICPPRTFLVEMKYPLTLKSIRIQSGVSYWQLASGKTVTINVTQFEQQDSKAKWILKVAPELGCLEVEQIWSDLIQLRGMCLDEDRRLINSATLHAPVSGG